MSSTGQFIGAAVGIAAAIFLPGFGQLYGLALLGATFGAASLGASIGGLFDPPRVAAPNFGSLGSAEGSPRYGFEKLQSTASPDLPVPVLYGTLKLAGNIIYQSDQIETSSVPNPGEPPVPIQLLQDGSYYISGGGFAGLFQGLVWVQQRDAFIASGGTRNQITRCIGVCEGEIGGIYDVRINDDPITDFSNCSYTSYVGTSNQTVDSRFTGVLDGLRYISYLALTLSTSAKLTGAPSVTFQAIGKLVKTWNGSEWSTTKEWSDNPAACIRDLLTSKQYGVGLPEASLDDDSFADVYEFCNGLVTGFNGQQVKRATLNYIIDARKNILDALNDMLATFGGFLVLNGSKIKLRAEKAEAAVQSFNMSNVLRGSFSYVYLNRNERPNRVKVQYVDPDYNYTKVFAISDDPNDQDERRSIGVGEDIIEKELSLLGVTNANQASRMAELILNLGKVCNIICTFDVGIRSIAAEPGDIINLSHDVTGWIDKPFRVLSIQEKEDDSMSIVAREYNASIYSDNPGQNIIFQNFGNGTSSFDDPNPPRNFMVFQTGSNLTFVWDAPVPKFDVEIDHYEIREGDTWGGGNIVANNVAGLTLTLSTFTTGVKTYLIRAVSTKGNQSSTVSDSIDIGIPAGFNAIIEYDDLLDTRFELGGAYSSGIEVIRTEDRDSTQFLRCYGIKTEQKWDEGTWDDGGLWDTPVITDDQTIVIGGNNEIDLLEDTTASVALDVNYYVGNDTESNSYTRTVEIATKTSDGDWSDYSPFVTGFSIVSKRYIKFQITIGTNDSEDNIRLITVDCRVDVPDKIERDDNVVVPAAGLSVQYNVDFLTKVAVTVTTVGTSTLIPITSNKSLNGFTVTLKDTAGVSTLGNVDWIASGY